VLGLGGEIVRLRVDVGKLVIYFAVAQRDYGGVLRGRTLGRVVSGVEVERFKGFKHGGDYSVGGVCYQNDSGKFEKFICLGKGADGAALSFL